jgi:hypothetical protein
MDQSATLLSYVWQVPAKPVSVHLSLEVIDRLGLAVKEGFKALPRRGLETGGLLLGSEKRVNGETVVFIEDFEPLESEHAFGPSYLLSAADRKLLEERVTWHRERRFPAVVGFYRGHTRRDFALTVEDIALMEEWFSRESNVFLLLQSNGDLPPIAGFAIWEGKKIRSAVPYGQFAFSRASLPQDSICQPVAAEPAAPSPARERQFSLQEWLPKLPARVDWGWIAAAAIVTLTLLVAVLTRHDSSRPPGPFPIGLDVRHDGGALRLVWDREAPVVRRATRAEVWIGDGGRESKLDLDPVQLAGGSIVYWPHTNDVNFRMEVFSPAARGLESVRAVGTPQPAPDLATDAISPFPELQPKGEQIVPPEPTAAPEVANVQPAARPAVKSTAAAASLAAPAAAALEVAAIPNAPAPMLPGALPHSRVLPFEEPPPPPSPRPENSTFPPGPSVMVTDSAVTVQAEPVMETQGSGLFGRLHLGGHREDRPGFVPPQPTHRAALAIPPNLRARAGVEVPIDVRVYVDQTGRVEYAELETEASRTDRDLAALAVFSSRRWQFTPARQGTRNVPGEVVLRYRFRPQ